MTIADPTHRDPGALVTALMPVRAYHEGYLHDAVRSMLRQTRTRWRLLVIVEPSRLARLEGVLGEHLADPRIEVTTNEGRKLAGAFNTGMSHAETEFVAILLGDDLWAPEAIEVLERGIAASPGVDFFHSSRRIIDETGRPISSVHASRPDVAVESFAAGTSPVKHLLCWRRATGLAIGGMDESLDSVGVDDFDFPWSMAEHGATFGAIPECLYVYRDHRECFRLTTHLPLSHHKREIARIMRKHGVDSTSIDAQVTRAERTYLRQCLYRSRLDRWLERVRRRDGRIHWRERYR